VQTQKKKLLSSIRWKQPAAPESVKLERLSRRLWEFSEQVRLATINRQERG